MWYLSGMSSTTIFSFRRKPRIFFRRDRRPFMAMVKYSTITRLLSQLVLGFLTATSHSIREIVALSKRQIYIFNIFSYDIWWSRKYPYIFIQIGNIRRDKMFRTPIKMQLLSCVRPTATNLLNLSTATTTTTA
jgi:hypothetical protein